MFTNVIIFFKQIFYFVRFKGFTTFSLEKRVDYKKPNEVINKL